MADPLEPFRQDLETAFEDIEILKRGDLPPGTDLGALPVIEAWGYSADTVSVPYLTGIVWGHPDIADGRAITLMPLLWFDARHGLARSTHSLVRLGRQLSEILRELVQRAQCDGTPLSKVRLDQIEPKGACMS